MDLAVRGGFDAVMRVARRFGNELTEETLGDAGYGLFLASETC